MEALAEESEAPLRSHSYLFGCMLTGVKRKVSFLGGGEDLGEQLTLRTASLGFGVRDEVQVLEVESETQDGSVVRVPLATLRPSKVSSVYLGGLELTPPVTFWLVAGAGPLYICGQHLVASTERKRPEVPPSALRPAARKDAMVQTLKEECVRHVSVQTSVRPRTLKRNALVQTTGRPPLLDGPRTPAPWPFFPEGVPPTKPALTTPQMKEKLLRYSRRGCLPKNFATFQEFVGFIFDTHDPLIVEQMWKFVLANHLI
ncbi:nucleophosmin-like [Ambystoma mexicanum]|uniref:nucleophosmin-like n=1 Tax=Ambystoma mexicanum TaxID=8296 RepID=UPI0037E950B9